VVGIVRERVMAGELKTGQQIRSALKESIRDILVTRGGSTELKLGDRE
jgi:fused signal recognition particle receptor